MQAALASRIVLISLSLPAVTALAGTTGDLSSSPRIQTRAGRLLAGASGDPWADEYAEQPRTADQPRTSKRPQVAPPLQTAAARRAGAAELRELGRQHEATVDSVRALLPRRGEVLSRLKKMSQLARKKGKGKAGVRAAEDLERELQAAVAELPGLRHVTLTSRTGMLIQSDVQLKTAIEQALESLASRDPRACFEGAALTFRAGEAACAGELARRCAPFVIDGGALKARELDEDLDDQQRPVGSAQDFIALWKRMRGEQAAVEEADYVFCHAAADGGATHASAMALVPAPATWTTVVAAADLGAADSKSFQKACLSPRRSTLAGRLKVLLRGPEALDEMAQQQLGAWKDALLLQRDACNEVVQERCKAVKVDGDDMTVSFPTSTGCTVRDATEKELEKEMSFLNIGGMDAGDTGKRLETLSVCRALHDASFRWRYERPKAGSGCAAPDSKPGELSGN